MSYRNYAIPVVAALVGGLAVVNLAMGGDDPGQPGSGTGTDQPQMIQTTDGLRPGEPGWSNAIFAEWSEKPRADQLINGINIGPTVQVEVALCRNAERTWEDESAASGSPMEIAAAFLPQNAELQPDPQRLGGIGSVVLCDGEPVTSTAVAVIPAADDVLERLEAGESWFAIPTGNWVEVAKFRHAVDEEPAIKSDIPASHWEEITINGQPAALGKPVLDEGLGIGELYIWDESTRILTQVRTVDVSVDDMIAIGEGLE